MSRFNPFYSITALCALCSCTAPQSEQRVMEVKPSPTSQTTTSASGAIDALVKFCGGITNMATIRKKLVSAGYQNNGATGKNSLTKWTKPGDLSVQVTQSGNNPSCLVGVSENTKPQLVESLLRQKIGKDVIKLNAKIDGDAVWSSKSTPLKLYFIIRDEPGRKAIVFSQI